LQARLELQAGRGAGNGKDRDSMNGPAMLRTFLVFFVGGLLTATAVISAILGGGIIWLDCLHDNPGHVCGDALLFAAISPFYGLLLGVLVGFLPIFIGAALAVVGRAFFHRVPLWYVTAMLPACVLAYAAQGAPWFPYDVLRPLSERVLMFAGVQAPALLICWWWDRREE
jgi:hypothetical protein